MTREEILTLPAGPEMNALVAEKIMGLTLVPTEVVLHDGSLRMVLMVEGRRRSAPSYSTDITAAWEVVDKLTSREYVKVRVSQSLYHGRCCQIAAADLTQRGDDDPVCIDAMIFAESVPLAICRAVLLATMNHDL